MRVGLQGLTSQRSNAMRENRTNAGGNIGASGLLPRRRSVGPVVGVEPVRYEVRFVLESDENQEVCVEALRMQVCEVSALKSHT